MSKVNQGYYNEEILSLTSEKIINDILNYHTRFIDKLAHKKYFELGFRHKCFSDIPLFISISLYNSKEHKYYGDDFYNAITIYIYIGSDEKLNDNSIFSMSFFIGKDSIFIGNLQRSKVSKALFEYNKRIIFDNKYINITNKIHRIGFYILNYFYLNLEKNNIYGTTNNNSICRNHVGFSGNYNNLYKSYNFIKINNLYKYDGKRLKDKNINKFFDIKLNILNYELFCILQQIKKYE